MSYRPPKNIVLLGLTSFFNDLSSEAIQAILPAFFISVLKSGAASLGLVEGLADGAASLIKLYSGRFSDLYQRRKPFVILGYSLSVLTRPAYLLVQNVAGVAGLLVADKIGKGFRESPRDALISLSTSKEEMGRAFGFHRAFDTLGAIVGPLVAYFILQAYPTGFHIVFASSFFAGILAVLTVLLVKEIAGEVRQRDISFSALSTFSSNFRRYLVALLFLSLGSVPVAVLLLKTQSLGLTLADIPLFYLVYNLSYAAFSFTAGKMSDSVGARKVIIAGYVVLVASYGLLAFAANVAVLVVAFLVLGLFPALTDGVQRALASELSSEDRRGGALGYVNATAGIGLLLAGVVGGYLWQTFGVVATLSAAGALVLVGICILLTVASPSEP
jgi:MFS family permease